MLGLYLAYQNNVGEQGREIDDFSWTLNTFAKTQEDNNPG